MAALDYNLILPLISFAAISLILYIMTNRSFVSLMGIMGLVSAVMVWNGTLPSIFYVVSIIFLGVGFWRGLFSDSASEGAI